jgi:hypothetical protein
MDHMTSVGTSQVNTLAHEFVSQIWKVPLEVPNATLAESGEKSRVMMFSIDLSVFNVFIWVHEVTFQICTMPPADPEASHLPLDEKETEFTRPLQRLRVTIARSEDSIWGLSVLAFQIRTEWSSEPLASHSPFGEKATPLTSFV